MPGNAENAHAGRQDDHGHKKPEQRARPIAHVQWPQFALTLGQVSQQATNLLPKLLNHEQEVLIIGQIKLIP